MMQKELIKGFSNMSNVDPAAEAARRQEAAEKARKLDEAHEADVKSVETQRLQAAQKQAASRKARAQELSQELQGLPTRSDADLNLHVPARGTQTGAGSQLKSAVFHGERAAQSTSPEAAREEASRVFDTPGKNVGKLKPIQKPASAENIPPEKMTPKIRQWVDERAVNRKKKQELEEKLAKLRAKEKLEPNETVEVVKLQQDISTAQNKENYYNFSINEELTKQPASSDKDK